MLRIVANVSKKLPIEGVDFSSQSYSAGMEVEVADAATDEQIRKRIAEVYRLLEATIDEEMAAKAGTQAKSPAPPAEEAGVESRPPDRREPA